MAKQILTIAAVSAALIFSSCASNNVSRVSSETVTDLSGYWNDTDVRLVAGEIIDGCLASPRIAQYPSQHGGKLPVVIVGSYRNKSDEHIDTEILTKKLEAALVNSGKVEFVASSAERNELRAERIDQQTNASESTAKSLGNETGADFMLQGTVTTIVDTDGRQQVRTYQVDMQLIDLETNRIIWSDQNNDIKKYIKKSAVKF